MSTFEIVKGVEGDCLVLDGKRICGPKPWGGGRIIDTFRTDGIYEVIDKDEYHKLRDENERLQSVVSDGADNARELRAENERLQKVCKEMHDHIKECCDVCDEYYCSSWDEDNECCIFDTYMRELGVGVTA